MSTVETTLRPEDLRAALNGFWNDALKIERTQAGLAVALPQTTADGWQLVVELSPGMPGLVRATDAGRTLGGLQARGQNIDAETVSGHIKTILQECQTHRDGLELFRWLPLPLDPVEVHVFAEGLAAISHLWILHEPKIHRLDVADQTLRRVFADRKLEAQAGATLDGKTEKRVRVDYLVQQTRPVAFEVLRRQRNLLPVMEQWGYRWQDLLKVSPSLMPVMLYDPAIQEIDEASRAIGEEVCTLFCAYEETQRIHAVLSSAA